MSAEMLRTRIYCHREALTSSEWHLDEATALTDAHAHAQASLDPDLLQSCG